MEEIRMSRHEEKWGVLLLFSGHPPLMGTWKLLRFCALPLQEFIQAYLLRMMYVPVIQDIPRNRNFLSGSVVKGSIGRKSVKS